MSLVRVPGGKVLAAAVSVASIYLTVQQVETVLTPEGRRLLRHPAIMGGVAYGAAYASVNDHAASVQALVLLGAIAYYALVLRPEVGERYFRFQRPTGTP